MISAWRKLTKKQEEKHAFPVGVAPVDQSMQKKYAKGVQYNMKIILKGDRNTGKSTLLQRLTGGKFKEEYLPTREIQVANVNWNYQGAADIVKVEVWDIVDKSPRKRTKSDSLKLANDEVQESPTDGMTLDAELINVYKGTHGVILTMDISKNWTWLYVQRELEKIPNHIPVLVMANFRDMGDHRVVLTDEIVAYIEHLDRPSGSAEVYFTEASMKDGFGLRFIYKFLNMPFLMLQRETLLRQLEANTLEIEDTRESLCIDTTSTEQNYGLFKDMMEETLNPISSAPSEQSNEEEETPPSNAVLVNTPTPPVQKKEATPKQLPVATVPPTIHAAEAPKQSKFQAYKAKLFGGGGGDAIPKKDEDVVFPELDSGDAPIDEFNPGQLDDDFLGGGGGGASKLLPTRKLKAMSESDDDEDRGNPMVAGYEDVESEDEPVFEQQFSMEADFDDLSEDERTKLEENEVSIIEQIKCSKKNRKHDTDALVNDVVVDTQTLDMNVVNEYDDLESDENMKDEPIQKNNDLRDKTKIDEMQPDSDVVREPLKSEKVDSEDGDKTVKQTVSSVKSDVDSDEDDEHVYVIADDVDVQDDWIKNEDSDINNDEGDMEDKEKEQLTTDEPDLSNDVVSTNVAVKDTSLNIDLDALEMFMSSQMKKTVKAEVTEETPKPKKKKKKTSAAGIQEASESAVEKKKKKKKKDTEISENEATTPSTKTKKTKSSDVSTGERKKKKSKKPAQKSELDSFFDS